MLKDKLESTYCKQTVYAWVAQNILEESAIDRHNHLSNDDSYLGMHGVDYSFEGHLALYRNIMIPKYRIYDTSNHFRQMKDFEEIITPYLTNKKDDAGELILLIEDTNPQLFNSFGASVRALSIAVNEEDYAHVGLSIRRFLENLAYTIFPAMSKPYKGRNVNKVAYKNRIWAFASDTENDNEKIIRLGNELERLIKEANSALHDEADKDRMMLCLIDLAKFSLALLSTTPVGKIDSYLPYQKRIFEILDIRNM